MWFVFTVKGNPFCYQIYMNKPLHLYEVPLMLNGFRVGVKVYLHKSDCKTGTLALDYYFCARQNRLGNRWKSMKVILSKKNETGRGWVLCLIPHKRTEVLESRWGLRTASIPPVAKKSNTEASALLHTKGPSNLKSPIILCLPTLLDGSAHLHLFKYCSREVRSEDTLAELELIRNPIYKSGNLSQTTTAASSTLKTLTDLPGML
ncbi:uncharacterized protein LOC141986436 isoform X1 [Natator depressus]|uniref:uncharacterized protein LOC141986436 isoform X1 n=1 Tax=Natator depressus TaxID=27790 RepID=UPI003EBE06CB